MADEREKAPARLFAMRRQAPAKAPATRGRPAAPRAISPGLLHVLLAVGLGLILVLLAMPVPIRPSTPQDVGEIAVRDIKAPRDMMVQDAATTRQRRKEARANAPSVFDLNEQSAQETQEKIHRLFARGRSVFNAPPVSAPVFEIPAEVEAPASGELALLRKDFHESLNLPPTSKAFDLLMGMKFSMQAERAIFHLVIDLIGQGIVNDKQLLLERAESGIVIRRKHSGQEELAPYPGVFPSVVEARRLVRERALLFNNDFTPAELSAIVEIAQAVVQPNLSPNSAATQERRIAAETSVAPVFFKVKAGEIIIRQGERIDPPTRLKLEALAQLAQQNWVPRAGGIFLVAVVLLGVVWGASLRLVRSTPLRRRDLLFMASLLLFQMILSFAADQVGGAMAVGDTGVGRRAVLYLAPLASGPMLATIFIGPLTGVFYAVVASTFSSLICDGGIIFFLYAFLGALAGLPGLVRVRERSAVARSGLLIGLVNMALIVALWLFEAGSGALPSSPFLLLTTGLLSGVLAGVLVTGLIPLFEMAFRYATDIKLLELANLDRPALRDLMVQAPGTYHHSVIVGAMVEAAAEAIGANPLLAKVSAYYHDLGKIRKPMYFVENQVGGDNKHEKLAPSMSALILISHVKDGVDLAKRNKLTPNIINIIGQHHGTSLIAFFYQKAKEARLPGQPEINVEDYRYPGPKPQTREAGLVMLADAVEAAGRSLADPTPARVQGLVQKIINNIFSDGQLDECELTLKDLHRIAASFITILTGIFHRRISYPEPAFKEKAANGSIGKQQTKDQTGPGRTVQGERREDLKRLGLS